MILLFNSFKVLNIWKNKMKGKGVKNLVLKWN